jgi:[acyl-carrier-protein] S-malonyltransferase
MGGAALLRSARVGDWLARASAIVGIDVRDAIEQGLPVLRRTEVAQPALTAVGLGLYEALIERGARPAFVAGHSVGEMAAFAAAGVFPPETAVELAAERGRLMAAAAEANPGGMLALKVESPDEVPAALAVGARQGWIEVGAENGPTEWVLTGDKAALAAVAARFTAVPLPVVGPWHSRGMREAEQGFRRLLARTPLHPPRCGLIANRDGRLVGDDADLADLLAGQLTRPIAWAATIATLVRLRTRTWVVLGPGRGLRGLVRKNAGLDAHVTVVQLETDLKEVAA